MTATFSVDIESDVICATCGHESSRVEPSFGLSLDLERDFKPKLWLEDDSSFRFRQSSLEKCLKRFTRLEFLSGSDALECQSCQRRSAFSKQLSLAKLPLVLSFHLKRFRHLAATKHSQKVEQGNNDMCEQPAGTLRDCALLCSVLSDRELSSLSSARARHGAVRDKFDTAKAIPQQSILP